jgi:superfamily II DNA or RNA helicase
MGIFYCLVMSRFFNKQQKRAGQIFFGVNGEADHIKPYSKGGATDVSNMQIIPSSVNKMKSAFEFKPRKWQGSFFEEYIKNIKENFLLIAVPGSGKTFAALEIARQWLRQWQDACVMIVVPSDNLRQQWQKEAVRFGMQLQTKEIGTNFKYGFQGGVVSYQGISKNPELYKAITANKSTLVIFDEVHHACETASFGKSISEAFCLAKKRLCMSGTPWNSSGKIAFIDYNDLGFAKADYQYGQTEALQDNVVRYLIFDYGKGKLKDIESGEEHSLDKDTNKTQAAWRLKRLLDYKGEFVRRLLTEADEKLNDTRKIMPDAGGLVVCVDQSHALQVAKVLSEITGEQPSIIISDALNANDSVEKFRKSKKKWLVSVSMVSEGTDIKRLQVLAYLTNATTPLFFRQVVGRVCRTRGEEDFDGFVFLPSDPRLITLAQEMENMQVQAYKEPGADSDRDPSQPSDKTFPMFETEHEGTDVYHINNREIMVADAGKIKAISKKTGMSESKVLEILEMGGFEFNVAKQEAETSTEKSQTDEFKCLEEELDKYRRACNNWVNKIVGGKKPAAQYKAIHNSYPVPQSKMTLPQLKAKLESLKNRYESNKRAQR